MKIFLEIMYMDVISEQFKNQYLYWKRGRIRVHCVGTSIKELLIMKGKYQYEATFTAI